MNKNVRKCPYCDSSISYLRALSELNSGEHTCYVCNKNSNISYGKRIYITAAILLAIAIGVVGMLFLFKVITNVWLALVLALIPFAAFYFLTPLYYQLEAIGSEALKPVVKVQPKNQHNKKSQRKQSEKIMSDKVKSEQKTMSTKKDNSKKSRFARFVETYILVPDDEKTENSEEIQKKSQDDLIQNIGQDEEKVSVQPVQNLHNHIEVVSQNSNIENKNKSENIDIVSDSQSTESFIDFDEEETEDLSNLNLSANDKTESVINEKSNSQNDSIVSDEVDVQEKTVEENNIEKENNVSPVYHKLTRTKIVDFVYYPENSDFILVNLTTEQKPVEEIQESQEDVLTDDDIDDNDALMFFESAPTEEEEKRFGSANLTPTEETEPDISENDVNVSSENVVREDEIQNNNIIYDDMLEIEYFPDDGNFITVNLYPEQHENTTVNAEAVTEDIFFDESDKNYDEVEDVDLLSDLVQIENNIAQAEDEIFTAVSEPIFNYQPENDIEDIVVEEEEISTDFDKKIDYVESENLSVTDIISKEETVEEPEVKIEISQSDNDKKQDETVLLKPVEVLPNASKEQEDLIRLEEARMKAAEDEYFHFDEEENGENSYQKDNPNDESYVVDYSENNSVYDDKSSAPVQSRYEKKFPNAAKAAAEEIAERERKKKENLKKRSAESTIDISSQSAKPTKKSLWSKLKSFIFPEDEKDTPEIVTASSSNKKQSASKKSNVKADAEVKAAAALTVNSNSAAKAKKQQSSVKKPVQKSQTERSNANSSVPQEKSSVKKPVQKSQTERSNANSSVPREKSSAKKTVQKSQPERSNANSSVPQEKSSVKKTAQKNNTNGNNRSNNTQGLKNSQRTNGQKRSSDKNVQTSQRKQAADSTKKDKAVTRVFEAVHEPSKEEYRRQEQIVIESVKDKSSEFAPKKHSEAEKVKIISEKDSEEKKRQQIERRKSEQAKQRAAREQQQRNKRLQDERLEKAEEIRQQQVQKARQSQEEMREEPEQRQTQNVSLKETEQVRSKVSQKYKKRKQQANNYFNN